ncbi:MAG: aminoglycoside phosphotransferase family protein [Pyrinomonadaceae bacterium]
MGFELEKIFGLFDTEFDFASGAPISTGHINDTFLITAECGRRFVLQRINHHVFPSPSDVMENKVKVSEHLKTKRVENSENRTLTFFKAKGGGFLATDETGNAWNLMLYIDGSRVHLKTPNALVAKEAGKAFGGFLRDTSDLNPALFSETLERFHSMSHRFEQYDAALANAKPERINRAADHIAYVREQRESMLILDRLTGEGAIPFRVTHNDTKISNALFSHDDKALCVIDLDTVMRGVVHYDFGDAVRTICSGADEDEPDESKIVFNMEYFRAFTDGFLGASGLELSERELETLALSAKIMTFIIGLRMLTDFLNNDIYFETKYEEHNLVRARNQFIFARLIEKNLPEMNAVVEEIYRGRIKASANSDR